MSKKKSKGMKDFLFNFKIFVRRNIILLITIFVLLLLSVVIVLKMDNTSQMSIESIDRENFVVVEVFHSYTCPYCIEQGKIEKYLENKYSNLVILKYDVTQRKTQELYREYIDRFDNIPKTGISTPTTIVNQNPDFINVGYSSPTTDEKLENWIKIEIDKLNKTE